MQTLKILVLINILAMAITFPQAKWHALVIGIDDYAKMQHLDGAVNDANDISEALRARKINSTVLLNKAAKYATVKRWWNTTLSEVLPGDTIVFTMAGHGALEPEHYPGTDNANDTERNQKDEVFVLAGYQDQGVASKERIVDQEILGWAKKATDKKARVIVLADFCYGAGATRSLTTGKNLGDALFTVRGGADLAPEDKTKRGTRSDAQLTVESPTFNNNLFIITPHENENLPIPEMQINGQVRGLASYLLGQLLRGQGDANKDGKLTLIEISRYLKQQSVVLSNKQQSVAIHPANRRVKDIAVLAHVTNTVSTHHPAGKPTVYVAGNTSDLTAVSVNYDLTKNAKTATFRWDRANNTVTKSGIGLIAYDIGNETDLLSVLANNHMVDTLRRADIPPITGNIVLSDEKHIDKTTGLVFAENDQVAIYTTIANKYRHLFLVNIAAKGAPQLVGYLPARSLQTAAHATTALTQLVGKTTVTPPFGADHLLLIALTDKALSDNPGFTPMMQKHAALSAKDRDRLVTMIKDVAKSEIGLGIVPFSTGK